MSCVLVSIRILLKQAPLSHPKMIYALTVKPSEYKPMAQYTELPHLQGIWGI